MAAGSKKWTTKKNLKQIEQWAEKGLPAAQIAANIGISRSTLYVWMKEQPDILDSFTRGRGCASAEVENALFKKCIGYNVSVQKMHKIRKVTYDDNGKKIDEHDELIAVVEEVHIPADTAAQKFWLINNMPYRYKSESKVEADIEDSESGVIELPAVPEKELTQS